MGQRRGQWCGRVELEWKTVVWIYLDTGLWVDED